MAFITQYRYQVIYLQYLTWKLKIDQAHQLAGCSHSTDRVQPFNRQDRLALCSRLPWLASAERRQLNEQPIPHRAPRASGRLVYSLRSRGAFLLGWCSSLYPVAHQGTGRESNSQVDCAAWVQTTTWDGGWPSFNCVLWLECIVKHNSTWIAAIAHSPRRRCCILEVVSSTLL